MRPRTGAHAIIWNELVRAGAQGLTVDQLVTCLWPTDKSPADPRSNIRVQMVSLRQRVETDEQIIATVRHAGRPTIYRLEKVSGAPA